MNRMMQWHIVKSQLSKYLFHSRIEAKNHTRWLHTSPPLLFKAILQGLSFYLHSTAGQVIKPQDNEKGPSIDLLPQSPAHSMNAPRIILADLQPA